MAAIIRISSSSSDTEYLVNPEALTCQCRDWIDRRQQFPRTDPRRLCKHLMEAILGEGGIPDSLAKYEDTLLRYANFEQRGFPLAQVWTTIQIARHDYDIFLPPGPNESWINIYSDDEKWGYHRYEERWSYDNRPKDAATLLKAIRALEAKIQSAPQNQVISDPIAPLKGNAEEVEAVRQQITELLETGANLVERGLYTEALRLYDTILTIEISDSSRADTLFGQGICFHLLGNINSAMAKMLEAATLGNEEAVQYLSSI